MNDTYMEKCENCVSNPEITHYQADQGLKNGTITDNFERNAKFLRERRKFKFLGIGRCRKCQFSKKELRK